MTWRTVKGHMLVSILVPFTVGVDIDEDRGEEFDPHQWIEDYNAGRAPDELEGAQIASIDEREHEVYEAVIHDAALVAESGDSGS